MVNKWPNNDAEEIGEIRENKTEKEGNKFAYKLKVFLKDENEDIWAEASDVAKDAPVMVAKYLIDSELTSKPGWRDIWKKIKSAQEKLEQNKISKPKQKEKEIYIKVGEMNKCPHDHRDWVNNFTVEEDNWKYWEVGNTFLNKHCDRCKGNMLDKKFRATNAKPAYCCKGRHKYFCGLCICHNCRSIIFSKVECSGRRSRRNNT